MHNKISYGNVLFLNRKKMEDANKFEDSKSNEPKAITILAPITHSDNILKSCVWCVAWNASGSLLASCGDDKMIRVWKLLPIG
jgi:WD40 repeat protein